MGISGAHKLNVEAKTAINVFFSHACSEKNIVVFACTISIINNKQSRKISMAFHFCAKREQFCPSNALLRNIDWSEEDGRLITRRSHLLAPETQALI